MVDVHANLLRMLQEATSARKGNVEQATQDVWDEIKRMPQAEREKYEEEFAKITAPLPPGFREDGDPQ